MNRIAFRLWSGMMALVLVVLLLLWFFQIVFLNSFYARSRIADVKKQAASIAAQIEASGGKPDEGLLESLAYDQNTTVELVDPEGNVLYTAGSAGQMPMMRSNAARAEVFTGALTGRESQQEMAHPRFNSRFVFIGFPAKVAGSVKGVLLVTLPLAPVQETAGILKRQLIYITGALLVLSLLLSFLLSRSFTKPILQITRVSEEMASGNLAARIRLKRKDEIGKLADTLNHMGQELSKIEQLRKDLIANVSHELRTPISLIRGYAETLRDVTGSIPEKREKQLGIMIEETERLGRIVEDILNLSQIQAGIAGMNPARFRLDELLDRTVRRFELVSRETGVELSVEKKPEAEILADEARMEQVLYNLISNAFNHTMAGGKITVNAFQKDENLRVEVSDTGEGIAEEDLPYIWDRFYKVDKSGARRGAGTGLGLSIVRSILEAHGFSYGVSSVIGQGTTFWFEAALPG